ncbi:MAG: SHOCT domain-containing protein [Bacteroidota bacterium]|nr:SHOCT domain-containing protein [Bacteroidota bacterium]
MFGWIIGVIVIIVLIVALGRGNVFQNKPDNTDSNTSALETLKKRYAKGEIDKEEFEERKAELEK